MHLLLLLLIISCAHANVTVTLYEDAALPLETLCKQSIPPKSQLIKPKNRAFQILSWDVGCEKRKSTLAKCSTACNNGCCGTTCAGNACSGGGCCTASKNICQEACNFMFAPQVYNIIQYTNVTNETRFIDKTRWINKTHNITIYTNRTRWTNKTHNVTRFVNKTRWINKTHNITIYTNRTRWTNKTHNVTRFVNKTTWSNNTYTIENVIWVNKTRWINKPTNQSYFYIPTVITEKLENTTTTYGKPTTVNDLIIWGSCLVIGFMGGCFFSYGVFKFKEFLDSWFGCLDCDSFIESSPETPPKNIDIQIHPRVDTLRRRSLSNSPKARKRMEI